MAATRPPAAKAVSESASSGPAAESAHVFNLVLLVVMVAVLYFAKEVLIPLALAALLTFILAPAVARLERLRLGRFTSIFIVVLASLGVLGLVGWAVAGQVIDLTNELPTYQKNIVAKIQQLKVARIGPVAKIQEALLEVNREIAKQGDAGSKEGPPTGNQSDPAQRPVRVEVVQPASSPLDWLSEILPGAFGGLATVGVVILFLIFMLAEREDLRNRVIRLIGQDRISITTEALDDAARRVSRYLRMQLIINSGFGLMLAAGLYLIGLPNALLWGFFAGLLRYIPYVGAWLAAAIAIAISFAVFDGWSLPLATAALFAVTEMVTGNFLEPILFHSSTGVSTIGILVAAVFWTWLWGAVGLVLSTPLTVCVVVLGRYVPRLEFFHVLLSDEQILPPGALYYQRLLVGDHDEANDLVQKYLADHSTLELFDDVLLPALALIEQDAHRGYLQPAKREAIFNEIRDLVEELPAQMAALSGSDTPLPPPTSSLSVICLPARDTADELAAFMLSDVLKDHGIKAEVLGVNMLVGEVVDRAEQQPASLIFISAVPPSAVRHTRHLCMRLKAGRAAMRIYAGIWTQGGHDSQIGERLHDAGADKVAGTLAQAIEQIERLTPSVAATSNRPLSENPEPVSRSELG